MTATLWIIFCDVNQKPQIKNYYKFIFKIFGADSPMLNIPKCLFSVSPHIFYTSSVKIDKKVNKSLLTHMKEKTRTLW